MISRLFIFLVACLVFIAPAYAITIRTGEHDGFTRVVFPLPEDVGWDVAEDQEGITVSLQGASTSIDTSLFFDRISRDRISRVRTEERRAILSLACKCSHTSYIVDNRLLVIDIYDEIAPPIYPKELVAAFFPQLSPRDDRSDDATRTVDLDSNAQTEIDANFVVDQKLSSKFPGLRLLAEIEVLRLASDPEQKVHAPPGSAALSEYVRASAGAGILTPSVDPIYVPPDNRDGALYAQLSNLRVTTNPGLFALGERPDRVVTEDKENCIRHNNWETIFSAHIGDRTANTPFVSTAVFDEFGQFNTQAAHEKAKMFLHFGMATEAVSLLSRVTERSAETATLTLISAFMLQLDPVELDDTTGAEFCAESSSLWRFLYAGPTWQISDASVVSAFSEFARLPIHMREALRRPLARRLSVIGAQDLLAELDSLMGSEDHDSLDKDTTFFQRTTTVEQNIDHLRERLKTARLGSDMLDISDPAIIDSFAVEHRGTNHEGELNFLYLQALNLTGDLNAAVEVLFTRDFSNFNLEALEDTRKAVQESGDDFLKQKLGFLLRQRGVLSNGSESAIDERLGSSSEQTRFNEITPVPTRADRLFKQSDGAPIPLETVEAELNSSYELRLSLQ